MQFINTLDSLLLIQMGTMHLITSNCYSGLALQYYTTTMPLLLLLLLLLLVLMLRHRANNLWTVANANDANDEDRNRALYIINCWWWCWIANENLMVEYLSSCKPPPGAPPASTTTVAVDTQCSSSSYSTIRTAPTPIITWRMTTGTIVSRHVMYPLVRSNSNGAGSSD